MKNILSESLKEPAKEFFIDVSELALDKLLEDVSNNSEILKDIPYVKWLLIGQKTYSVFQSAHFIRKWANFIGQISAAKIEQPIQKALIKNLSKQDHEQIVENTILYLDRYQNEIKARLLGELFNQTFTHNTFIVDEYNSLMFSIELLHPFNGINTLKKFYEYRRSMEKETDQDKRRNIWSKGDSSFGNLGGAYLNDIGVKFYEEVVLKCTN